MRTRVLEHHIQKLDDSLLKQTNVSIHVTGIKQNAQKLAERI